MPYIPCVICGTNFWRGDDEEWKRKCYHCWRKAKDEQESSVNEVQRLKRRIIQLEEQLELLDREDNMAGLFKYISFLIFACHPDRVPASKQAMAHEVLVWLNDKREQFKS